MMLFELRDRAKTLPLCTKIWMYPVAYLLTGIARSVVWAVDTFNTATYRRMVQN